MRRTNRYSLAGYVWHITHRCHHTKFLLKFARDRRRYLHWAFEAKRRYGLCVLDYMVTSNHIHLLVKDTGANVTAESMQLIAGGTAQKYTQRQGQKGAFGEDRYLTYIDLNMVRAGVVNYPGQWKQGGFFEIQMPPKCYAIIDLQSLSELSRGTDLRDFQRVHGQWLEQGLENGLADHDDWRSEAIAARSSAFVETINRQ